MGHQVNFYATADDLRLLQPHLEALGDFRVLASRAPGPLPQVLDFADLARDARARAKLYLVRPGDVPSVVTDFIDTQGYWSIQELTSPVIDISLGGTDGASMGRSRFYYTDGYYDPTGAWQFKPEPFRKWADKVLATIRRRFKKLPKSIFYIGADAERWVQTTGGTLRPV